MATRVPFVCFAAMALSGLAAAQNVQVDLTAPAPSAVKEAIEANKPVFDALPRSPLEARRQARKSGVAIKAALNAQGYYDPKIDIAVDPGPPITPRVRVDIGPKFSLASVDVVYDETPPRLEDQAAVLAALPVAEGQAATPKRVIEAERVIISKLRELGYAYAEAADRKTIGDRSAATLSISYQISPGRRVIIGEAQYPSDIRTKTNYLDRLLPFLPGQLYSPDDLALFNRRLSETRLFDVANVRLSNEVVSVTDEGDEVRDLVLTLKERPRNTVQLGGSFSTADGYGAQADLIRRNVMRRGDVLEAQLNIAELDRSLDIIWRRPNELGYGRGLILSAGISDETTDAFDRQSIRGGAGFEVIENERFSWTYGLTGEAIRETDTNGQRDIQVATAYLGARFDRADSVLDPRRGWRADVRVAPSYVIGETETHYLRAVGQVRGYVPFGADDRFVLAGRLRAGSAFGASVEDLPTDRRFYGGGGGSVRGYAYQAIGPRDENDDPIGGRALLEGALEVRWQATRNFGFVGFIDAGSVVPAERPSVDDVRVGAGLGVRYRTPAGPIRFDLAVPLDKGPSDDPVQVYISIGQAF